MDNTPASADQPSLPARIDVLALTLSIAVFGWCAWTTRYSLGPDAMSYLEIGEAYLRGAWSEAVNPLWSPLYSWVLAALLAIIQPTDYWEFPVVALAHVLIGIAAFFSMRYLVNELIEFRELHRKAGRGIALSDAQLRILAYAIFLFISYTVLRRYAQDLLMSCFLYLAIGILLRILRGEDRLVLHVAMGVTCGVGYLSKSVFWPLTLVLLVCVLLSRKPLGSAWRGVVACGTAFAVVALPFAASISCATGHWTLGEAGRMNFHRFVGDTTYKHNRLDRLKGRPSASSQHYLAMGRKIYDEPGVWEFGTSYGVTYPLHYEPARWNYHVEPHLALSAVFRSCCDNLVRIVELLVWCATLTLPACILLLKTRWNLKPRWEIAGVLLAAIPLLAGIAMYVPILVELRYVAHFFAALLVLAFAMVELDDSRANGRLLTAILRGSLAASVVAATVFAAVQWKRSEPHVSWHVASQLRSVGGLVAGQRVCVLGRGTREQNWARLARVQIAGEILEPEAFLTAPEETRRDICRLLREHGMVAIVDPASGAPMDGWRCLTAAPMRLLRLDRAEFLASRAPASGAAAGGEPLRR